MIVHRPIQAPARCINFHHKTHAESNPGLDRHERTEQSLMLWKLESWGYPPVKTAWSLLVSFWHSASVWQTDRRICLLL